MKEELKVQKLVSGKNKMLIHSNHLKSRNIIHKMSFMAAMMYVHVHVVLPKQPLPGKKNWY